MQVILFIRNVNCITGTSFINNNYIHNYAYNNNLYLKNKYEYKYLVNNNYKHNILLRTFTTDDTQKTQDANKKSPISKPRSFKPRDQKEKDMKYLEEVAKEMLEKRIVHPDLRKLLSSRLEPNRLSEDLLNPSNPAEKTPN